MRAFSKIIYLVYQYAIAFVIVATPFFFVPTKMFAPDVTYYVVIVLALFLASLAYVVHACIEKQWHPVSKFELVSLSVFSSALVLSSLFAADKLAVIFGNGVNPFSAGSLLAIPLVVYLVRVLPEDFRNKLKKILIAVLGVSAFLFMFTFMIDGSFGSYLAKLFSGFSSVSSLSVYVGLFVIALWLYIKKAKIHLKHKTIIGIGSIVFTSLILTLAYSGDIRPNMTSSLSVGSKVLLNDGVFGIGSGDFARAWQLYRPEKVIASEYYGIDFNQSFGTLTTLLSTIGIFGILAFLFMVIGSAYLTYKTYRKTHEEKERFIVGLLSLILVYLAIVSIVVPLSYSIMILWAVVMGFGLAKIKEEGKPSTTNIRFLIIPLVVIFAVHSIFTFQKTYATNFYNEARVEISTNGPTDEAEKLLNDATEIFNHDNFYRAKVEYAILREKNILTKEQASQDELRKVYLEKAQYAVDSALAGVKVSPYNYQNYVSLGRAYELAVPFDKNGGYERARKAYNQAMVLYPKNPLLYLNVARLEASAGTEEGVRVAIGEALKLKPDFTEALYFMSQLEVSKNNIDEAINYAVRAVNSSPKEPTLYVHAGLLLLEKRDYQNATVAFQKAAELEPSNGNTLYYLAVALRDGGRRDLAKPIAEELLKRNPGSKEVEELVRSLLSESSQVKTKQIKK